METFQNHTTDIVSIVLLPGSGAGAHDAQSDAKKPTLVVSASKDGLVYTWKVPSGAVVSKVQVEGNTIYNMLALAPPAGGSGSGSHKLLVLVPNLNKEQNKKVDKMRKRKSGAVGKISRKAVGCKLIVVDVARQRTVARLGSFNSDYGGEKVYMVLDDNFVDEGEGAGEEYVFVASRNALFAWSASRKDSTASTAKSTNYSNMTCIASNGSKNVIATGHANGQIVLWYGVKQWLLSGGRQEPTCQVLHWHAHAVTAVSFNVTGEYLHSGGEEGVLVSWELQTGTRTLTRTRTNTRTDL